MKNLILILVLLPITYSCIDENNSVEEEANYIGVWKLIEELNDPGDGSGVFRPAENDVSIVILADGTYYSTIDFCRHSSKLSNAVMGRYNAEKSVFIPPICPFYELPVEIPFSVKGDELIIRYQCREACLEKYIRVSNSTIKVD